MAKEKSSSEAVPVDPGTASSVSDMVASQVRVPRVGEIVAYRVKDGRSAGQIRPAMVLRDPFISSPGAPMLANLSVFFDGGNDDDASNFDPHGSAWVPSAQLGTEPGQWTFRD